MQHCTIHLLQTTVGVRAIRSPASPVMMTGLPSLHLIQTSKSHTFVARKAQPLYIILTTPKYRSCILCLMVVGFHASREKPLVLYVFSKDAGVARSVAENTSSGGMVVNDTIMHMGVDTLPFGGVGNSGIGAYHGKHTFDTFTHKKSCLIKNFAAIGEKLAAARYPPYTDGNLTYITMLMRKRFGPSLRFLPYLLTLALGAGIGYGAFAWQKYASEDL